MEKLYGIHWEVGLLKIKDVQWPFWENGNGVLPMKKIAQGSL